MKKKIIWAVLALVILGGMVMVPVVAGANRNQQFDDLNDLIDAHLDRSEKDAGLRSDGQVASVNGQMINEDDIAYERAHAKLYFDTNLSDREAIESAAIKIIIHDEAEKLGVALSEEEVLEIRQSEEESYQKSFEENEAARAELGVSKEELLDTYVDVYVNNMNASNYCSYIIAPL